MTGTISLHNISYNLPGGDELFTRVSAVFSSNQKVAIVGDNGVGKTTLLRIIAGELEPFDGNIIRNPDIHFMPQMVAPDKKSGGERQRAAIARAFESYADILILDEPTNNLDADARRDFFNQFYGYSNGIIVVSHDRELLSHVDTILELTRSGIRTYGGNYEFYQRAKDQECQTLEIKYSNVTREISRLNDTRIRAEKTRNTHVKKQEKDKKNSAKGPPIVANSLKGKSDETLAKTKRIINEKLDQHNATRMELSEQMRDDKIKIPLPAKPFIRNELIRIENMTFGYDAPLFQNFDLLIRGGMRIRITGNNGAGKTTLIKLIMGTLNPTMGSVRRMGNIIYLDQDLSIMDKNLSIVDNIMNISGLNKNMAFAIAANFGFRNTDAKKLVSVLSGGELLRATLATVLGTDQQPDLFILDEPTNNLDIKSVEILEDALNQFGGAILIISHDDIFIKNINIDQVIDLNKKDKIN